MADTIVLMKQRVLDMAIRGELVDQQPDEGTAEELYQEIHAKRIQLIKDKRFKIEKILTEKKLNNLPFTIPLSWKWTHFGEVLHLISGRDLQTKDFNESERGLPYITGASNFYNSSLIINRWTEKPKVVSIKSDLLITVKGTVGDMHIQEIDEAHIARQVMAMRNIYNLQISYIKYFLDAQIIELKDKAKSMIPGISREDILLFEFPLPPLQEQKRIVAKIEEIFTVIDQIGTKKKEALSIIKNMRQTALQDAIMGVLVEQDETDEPASALYKKIQAEKERLVKEKKIKKEKTLPEIEADEIPFEIPESWKWVRFNSILDIRDGTHDTPKYHKEGIPLITSKNLKSGDIDFTNIKYISEDDHRKIAERSKVDNGDILFAMIGTIGNPVLVNTETEFSIKNVALFKNYPNKNVETKYILYFLKAIEKQLKEEASGAVQSFLSLTYLRKLLIPFPPIAEQYRIIEKLDEIMAIYDQMEAIFDGSSEMDINLNVV